MLVKVRRVVVGVGLCAHVCTLRCVVYTCRVVVFISCKV